MADEVVEIGDHTFKILVVDDEPDLEPLVRQRMRREIRAGRYDFVFAHNGVEALKELEADETIDMVLSDINMPQMDGLTLLQEIPKAKPNIRSVIISAYGDMQNIRTAMNRGAFDFITKPVDFDDLRLTIDRTLRHVQELRDALSTRDRLVAIQKDWTLPRIYSSPSFRRRFQRARATPFTARCSLHETSEAISLTLYGSSSIA